LYARRDIAVKIAVGTGEYMDIFTEINDVSRKSGKRK
jgi:hypothetical protein